jgi:thiamine-phosphate pyrophosphorylase
MDSTLDRLLDANLNRAREALRVIEDYLRFACDDADAAARAKSLRHQLAALRTKLGGDQLLVARDVAGDVGREQKAAGERARDSLDAVVRAEFGRLAESLRALGEFGKLGDAPAAAAAERLRYAVYELEQCVLLRAQLRERFRSVRLYVILTEALCRRGWLETAESAIRGGAGCIQLREKNLPDAELLRRALRLRELTAAHSVLLIVNDRPDIARLGGADGVHLGQEDLSVAEARRIAGGRLLIGLSTHTREQLDAAVVQVPDYIAVGPMYPSATKPQPHVAGQGLLAEAVLRTSIPIVAIGGIAAERASELAAAGARCLCVSSAVISADNPEAAAREILGAFAR